MTNTGPHCRPVPALLVGLLCAAALSGSGCAVVSVAGTAVSVGAGAVGLTADAAIGTAKLAGKGAGAAIDAFSEKDDHSGLRIRFREAAEADRAKRRMAEQQAREYEEQQAQQQAQEEARRAAARASPPAARPSSEASSRPAAGNPAP